MGNMNQAAFIFPCHGENGNQYWWMNRHNYLMRDYLCVGVLDDGVTVGVMDCQKSGGWNYNQQSKRLRHNESGKCLAVVAGSANQAKVAKCKSQDDSQVWEIGKYNRKGLKYKDLLNDRPAA